MAQRVAPSVESLAEFKAIALALKLVDANVRKSINKAQRDSLNPIWREEVAKRAVGPINSAVFGAGTRVAAGNPARLVAGSSKKALSGGLVPDEEARAIEFGTSKRNQFTKYQTRSEKGKVYSLSRRTKRQIRYANKKGYVVYPAFAASAPRITSLYVQICMRELYKTFEDR